MNAVIDNRREDILALCEKYGVEELAVFGSALRGELRPGSDIDFLVVFKNDDYGSMMEKLTDLEDELSTLLGCPVDLVSKRSVEQSENYIRREHILSSASVIYVA